jgi:zinc transporter 1/2/3
MSLITYKLLAGILIFLASLVAVAYPLKIRALPSHNRLLELGDAFASGIFLGAALFHMLPDSTRDFASTLGNVHYPLAELCCAGGFLLLLFFERLSGNSSHHDHSAISLVIAIIIIIHSFIEGAALGVNTTFATASIIFLAIIIHKSSEGFMLAITLNRSELSLKAIIPLISIFALMTPLGIAFGTSLTLFLQVKTGQLLTAGFNAFAAGTFLYMSTLHHINHHQRSHHGEGLIEFMAVLAGLSIMAGLAIQI